MLSAITMQLAASSALTLGAAPTMSVARAGVPKMEVGLIYSTTTGASDSPAVPFQAGGRARVIAGLLSESCRTRASQWWTSCGGGRSTRLTFTPLQTLPSRAFPPRLRSAGNTETVAGYLAAKTGLTEQDIGDLDGAAVAAYDGLIVGAPTWHTGADSERSGTAWDEFLYGDLTGLDLSGKKVAIFGCGDSGGYSDNFCDAMDELASCFKAQGAEIVGAVSTDDYDFTESKSVVDGKFVGLATDEDQEPEKSEDRVNAWVDQIKGEGMPL